MYFPNTNKIRAKVSVCQDDMTEYFDIKFRTHNRV